MAVKKGGRPKSKNPKTEPFGFRATKSEAQQIKNLAMSRGISPGEFCRLAALTKRFPPGVPPEINRRSWSELGRIGNNLNQIARNVNQSQKFYGLESVLEELNILIQQIRLEVLGVK